jgi:hypothetical protein
MNLIFSKNYETKPCLAITDEIFGFNVAKKPQKTEFAKLILIVSKPCP